MQENKNNNPHPNRLVFPIDLLTTIKATGGVESLEKLREFIINQVIVNLDEEFMNDQEIRCEWQEAIVLLDELQSAVRRHKNTNHDEDLLETIKFLEDKRIELIAEMEVENG